MRRVFFSNLVFVVLLNLLVKPLWVLGIDREAQNALGRETYGLYFALFNLSYMLNILIDMGVSYYNSRAVAGNPSSVKTLMPHAVALKLMLAAVYLAASLLLALVTGMNHQALIWLLVLCVNQVLQSFTIYLRTNLSALQHYRLDSMVSVLDRSLMIVLFGAFLWTPLRDRFTIDWFVYGQALCFLVTLLVAVVLNMRFAGRLVTRLSVASLRGVWKRSYPYAVLVLFMSVYARADGVMLERLVSADEAGVYASGYRLFDAVNQFGYLFAMLLMPMFSRMLANKENVQKLAEFGFAVLFMFTAVAIAGSWAFRNEIMELLYVEADGYSANVFALVMASLPGSAAVYIFGTLLAANANLKQLNIITAVGAFVNVLFNAVVIPLYGALGAAVVSAMTHTLVGLLEIAICVRLFGFEKSFRFGLQLLLFAAVSFAVFYGCRLLPMPWWVGLSAGTALSGLAALGTGLVRPQQLASLLRSRAAR